MLALCSSARLRHSSRLTSIPCGSNFVALADAEKENAVVVGDIVIIASAHAVAIILRNHGGFGRLCVDIPNGPSFNTQNLLLTRAEYGFKSAGKGSPVCFLVLVALLYINEEVVKNLWG